MELIIKNKREYIEKIKYDKVPKIIWCYWDGDEMNDVRKKSLSIMAENLGVPICLITQNNIDDFILPDYPIHKAFKYLSSVHKSDYFRIYLMHFYGGGWHDIKQTKISFEPFWGEFKDESVFLVGKKEVKNGAAKIVDSYGRWLKDFEEDLVCCSWFIAKPKTKFTNELLLNLNKYLDNIYKVLKKNPAKNSYDRKKSRSRWALIRLLKKKGYPIEYTMFGNIFHPLVLKYKANIKNNLPHDKLLNLGEPYR